MRIQTLLHALSPSAARILPFAVFMGWIAVEELLVFLGGQGTLQADSLLLQWLYLPRMLLTAGLLIMLWPRFTEIRLNDLLNTGHTLLSIGAGMVIFILWINLDWTFSFQGQPRGFNPELFADTADRWLMYGTRIVGAVLVVPVMEELFWRSWLARYLIDADFSTVTIGRFTLASFLITSVLFGLEHHFVVAGLVAGVLFNALCQLTRSIAQCILAHAVANLLLAAYVLVTRDWLFW